MVENTEKIDRKYTILDCESKFLNLFGYQVIGPDGSNRYQILDTENEEVGYIQYKKFQSKNIKKGTPATYGYVMEINSEKIKCKRSRKENVYNDNYTFYLIKNGAEEPVELYLGENPSITIWSKEQGYISFSMSANQLICNFKRKTKKYNIEHDISVECGNYQERYGYCVSFCDIDKDLESDEEVTAFAISFEKGRYDHDIKIKETNWKDRDIIFENEFRDEATIYDAIHEFKEGLNAFRYFRYIMSQYLPFQKELVESFVEIVGDINVEITPFITDVKETQQNKTFVDKCKEYLRVRRK